MKKKIFLEKEMYDDHGLDWWDKFPMSRFTGRWKEIITDGEDILWFEITDGVTFWFRTPKFKWISERILRFKEVSIYRGGTA